MFSLFCFLNMKLKPLFTLSLPAVSALLLSIYLIGATGDTGGTGVSLLWGENGELHDSYSRLPDFSHAGYKFGESSVPDFPVVANVMDFGAVGDGVTDDAPAIRAAINATQNGALFVPAGRYMLGSPIIIRNKENFVLRGAGEGLTTFYMPQSMTEVGSSKYAYFLGTSGAVTSARLGAVALNANRGDRILTLDSAPAVSPGDLVNLKSGNHPDLGRNISGGVNLSATTASMSHFVNTLLRVTAVNGNTITFANPLRTDVRPEWGFELFTYSTSVKNVGFEDFTCEMLGTPKPVHLQELGFNGVGLSNSLFGWVRRVTVIDADNGIGLGGARFCEVSDVTLKAVKRQPSVGNTGHHGLSCSSWAQGNLFTRFKIETPIRHSITVSAFPHGNVFSNGEIVRAAFDHHGNLPYENLFSNIYTDSFSLLYNSGGNSNSPNSGARTTLWNVTSDPGVNAPGLPGWGQMNVIGVPGYSAAMSASGQWVEPIADITPLDLHQAQRAKRLGLPTIERPEAVLIADKVGGRAPLVVNFDGSESRAFGGSVVSYLWDFGDGATATGANVTHTFGSGSYEVCLRVISDTGAADTQTMVINTGESISLQAEDANLTAALIESAHAGFNGTGFVNNGPSGSSIEWVNVDGGRGGDVELKIRYALGNSARQAMLVINGVAETIIFDNSGGWATWVELPVTVSLNEGATNTIRIETTGADSGNIDQISLPTNDLSAVTLQAEDATLVAASMQTNASGYNGSAFINLGPTGSSIEWSGVDGGDGGDTTIQFRYSLGSLSPRAVRLTVNGLVKNISFTDTGSWSNWVNLDVPVVLLQGGNNRIKVETIGQDSGNIDQLTVLSPSSELEGYSFWQSVQDWNSVSNNLQGPNDDADNDGISNSLERILGTSPTLAEVKNPIHFDMDGGFISLSYTKVSHQFISQLQYTEDLEAWSEVPNSKELFNANTGKYFYKSAVDQNARRKFYRIHFIE